jgi:hypothetical protein
VREVGVRIKIRNQHSLNKNYKFHDLIELAWYITCKPMRPELKRKWNERFVAYFKVVLVFERGSE